MLGRALYPTGLKGLLSKIDTEGYGVIPMAKLRFLDPNVFNFGEVSVTSTLSTPCEREPP